MLQLEHAGLPQNRRIASKKWLFQTSRKWILTRRLFFRSEARRINASKLFRPASKHQEEWKAP
jgi:hypothetical protein